ncbi:phytoene/squalene synthase family protein [Persicirhabdus sediminis]|uniref:Squalene/phytoene synthase family protein n=1 Tax=Persicirhabdus sediminis TaxID=454144 RepID=A0A8J7MC93_9BACT|nr:phytoene/squalene synthase family protein [Persicirhabdus sediminis]MBK1789787.1 squalene/phytoene synthase family protein [Persicirhabdus sediminis]
MKQSIGLDRQLLKDVSRSFYLSIRFLPAAMRRPVALGYLLARASDTIADTVVVDAGIRIDLLSCFTRLLDAGDRSELFDALNEKFVPQQKHAGEAVLLRQLDRVFSAYDALPEGEMSAVREVMQPILHGQSLDLQRFEVDKIGQLDNFSQLEEYCYLVAGCVGEFWTKVGFLTLPNYSKAAEAEMLQWGIEYGKGLQLINILRDQSNDLKEGRCYIPSWKLEDAAEQTKIYQAMLAQARAWLHSAYPYSRSLSSRLARGATVLPALIGEDTLDLLENSTAEVRSQGVKVRRSQVYQACWQAFIFR